MSGNRVQSKIYNEYKDLLLKFVYILCSSRRYRSRLVSYIKRSYFPIQECL